MKIRANNAIIAMLDLTMEMAAKQRVTNRFLATVLSNSDTEVAQTIDYLNKEVDKELSLIRAKVFQYSEIDPDDLMDGLFDV